MLDKIKTTIRKKFVIDFIWNLIAFGFVAASVTIINVIVGNWYQPSGLGLFNYSYSTFVVLSTFCVFGIKSSTIKYVSEDNELVRGKNSSTNLNRGDIGNIVLPAMLIALSTSLLTIVIFSLFIKTITAASILNRSAILKILPALPVFAVNEVMMGLLNGLRKMKAYAMLRTTRWALILSFVVFSIVINKPVEFSLYAFIFSELSLFLILSVLNLPYFKVAGISKVWVKKHISFGPKAMLTQATDQLDGRLAVLYSGLFLSSAEVGIYSFAATVISGLIMIPSVVALNLNPLISNLWKNNLDTLKEKFSTLKKSVNFVIIPSFFLAFIFYPVFISLFMKNDIYKESVPIFYILLAGSFILSTAIWKNGFFPMIGKPEKQFMIRGTSLLVNAILSFILIRNFGLKGVALSTFIVNVFFALLLNLAIKKEILKKQVLGIK